MKLTSTILKLIAVLLAAFAVVCLVMANLERITRCVDAVSARLQAKKEALRRACPAAPARWRTSSRTGISKTGIRADRVPPLGDWPGRHRRPGCFVSALKRQPGVFGGQGDGVHLLDHREGKQGGGDEFVPVIALLYGHHADPPPTCTGVARQKR